MRESYGYALFYRTMLVRPAQSWAGAPAPSSALCSSSPNTCCIKINLALAHTRLRGRSICQGLVIEATMQHQTASISFAPEILCRWVIVKIGDCGDPLLEIQSRVKHFRPLERLRLFISKFMSPRRCNTLRPTC
jgi:hypothetical protein